MNKTNKLLRKMLSARLVHLLLCLIPMINLVNLISPTETKDDLRIKRQINSLPLVFPYGATYKLLVGFALPVPTDVGLLFVANFQYQYLEFQNITQLSQYYFIKEVSREQREADALMRKDDRLVFYRSLADMLMSKGLNGLDCVLRAICEAAQNPVHEEGLVGEILHILLTPDYGRTAFDTDDQDFEETMAVYKDAAIAGRQMFHCAYIYNRCPEGQAIMDFISVLRDE